jgi:Activator of Hsp90 ATPase homolog 1-like protein
VPGYEFLTAWVLDAPRERVWEAIWESERWPEWWRGVERVVELESGDAEGLGQLSRYTWRSKLPYELDFEMRTTRVERPHLLEGEASGELAGTGRWRLFEENGAAAVIYEWDVATTKPWMNVVAPLLRPAFAWNHDWVMRNGGRGLAGLLGCRLLVSD